MSRPYRYGDPALGRPLVDVSTQLFGMSWPALQKSMRSADEVASEGTLRRVALGAARRFDELRTSGFDLSGLPHEQLVATARGEARACWVEGA